MDIFFFLQRWLFNASELASVYIPLNVARHFGKN